MRALILACFLLTACGTEDDTAGTPAGCPEAEIDLTVPQVLTYCIEGRFAVYQTHIDTGLGRCALVSPAGNCTPSACEILSTSELTIGGTHYTADCDGLHSGDWQATVCDAPHTLSEDCQWLTE